MDALHLDSSTLIIIALVIMVIVLVWVLFRRNPGTVQVKVKGPGGMEADVNASNQPPPTLPAAVVKGSTSRKGGILAKDATGRGALVDDSEAEQHVIATVTPPNNTPPKT